MEEEVINHAWFGLSVDLFISLILKGWVMLGRKWSSGQTPLPTEAQGLRVSVNTVIEVMVTHRGRSTALGATFEHGYKARYRPLFHRISVNAMSEVAAFRIR